MRPAQLPPRTAFNAKHGGGRRHRLLYRVYQAVVRGDEVLAAFIVGLLVVIPGPVRGIVAENVVSASGLPPLTFSNSCQEIVDKALHAPLEAIAGGVVHEAQREFVRCRHMSSNIVGAYDEVSGRVLILLCIQAAFPNLGWGWTRWVLEGMRMPPWLVRALFATYHWSQVELLMYRRRTGVFLRITRAIKQGCPASRPLPGLLSDAGMQAAEPSTRIYQGGCLESAIADRCKRAAVAQR